MKKIFDKIIICTNDNPDFYDFFPLVINGWKTFFPETELILTFVTNRTENDKLVSQMKEQCKVVLYPEIPNIPTPNLAKVSRMIEATKHGSDICMVQDIDLLPLQSKYLYDRLQYRNPDELYGIGIFTGKLKGKFPMLNAKAESYIWKEIVNPNNLNYKDLIESWVGMQVFDLQESINNPPSDGVNPKGFSDESLLRALNSKWKNRKNIKVIDTNVTVGVDTIDRACWENLDKDKLFRGEYTEAHLIRPYKENYNRLKVLIDYMDQLRSNNDSINTPT